MEQKQIWIIAYFDSESPALTYYDVYPSPLAIYDEPAKIFYSRNDALNFAEGLKHGFHLMGIDRVRINDLTKTVYDINL